MNGRELAELGRKLRIDPAHKVAVVNAPRDCAEIIPTADLCEPDRADAVIGFVTRRSELELLTPVFQAALAGRLAWISYPKPDRLDTDLRRDLIVRDVRRYDVQVVAHVWLDDTWSALLLDPMDNQPDPLEADIDVEWPNT